MKFNQAVKSSAKDFNKIVVHLKKHHSFLRSWQLIKQGVRDIFRGLYSALDSILYWLVLVLCILLWPIAIATRIIKPKIFK